jgi:hypothetical protein
MLLILAGRIVAPLYLEGNLIRELIANNGTLPVKILNRQFNYISSFNEHIERLINRDLVEVKDDVVILKDQKYKK